MVSDTALHLRASSVPLAWRCAESCRQLADEARIDRPHEITEQGSAFHKWAESIDLPQRADVGAIATRYDVDSNDIDQLCAYASVAWRELQKWHAGGETEYKMEYQSPLEVGDFSTISLEGTADRLRVDGTTGYVLDWKSGWLLGDYEHQQRAYAFLTLMCVGKPIEKVYTTTVHVRLGFYETKVYTAAELRSWFDDLKLRLRNGLGKFNPGAHCDNCSRHYACVGSAEFNSRALAAIQNGDGTAVVELTHENKALVGPQLAEAFSLVKYVEKRCKEFREALKTQVMSVGEMPTGDNGKVLRIIEMEKRSLDPKKAWPVLQEHMDIDEINRACTVSLAKCQDVVGAKAADGTKGVVRKQLLEELETAGAVHVKRVEQLREVKGTTHV